MFETGDLNLNYLLHLEACKRYADDVKNIQRQVEEHGRAYKEARSAYLTLYTHLAETLKLVSTRCVLDSFPGIDTNQVEQSAVKIAAMSKTISGNYGLILEDTTQLDICKSLLAEEHSQPRHLLSKQQQSLLQNQEKLNALRTTLERVENGLDEAILKSINDRADGLFPV